MTVDWFAVKRDNDIACLQFSCCSWTFWVNTCDHGPFFGFETNTVSNFMRDILHLDPDPSTRHMAVAAQLLDDSFGVIGRNGKTDADGTTT